MTPRAVGAILSLLGLLCLASWLFAYDAGERRRLLAQLPAVESTPAEQPPADLVKQTQTSEEAARIERKVDTIIELAEDLRAYLREQREKPSKASAQKRVTIVNKFVMPTPLPTPLPAPTAMPDTNPKHGGLLAPLFR